MSEKTPKDSHYARLRRQHRGARGFIQKKLTGSKKNAEKSAPGQLYLYGLHTVSAALANPKRKLTKLFATQNALARLSSQDSSAITCPIEIVQPRALDNIVGTDAVHQGVVLETEPLKPRSLRELGETNLVIVLDQITDPHNVGAIMRSSVAFRAGAVITTHRHSAQESGVLAKSASGALELIDYITARNLAEAIEELNHIGFQTLGLDSEGPKNFEPSLENNHIAIVLGAEGKGLRQKTRETVTTLARLDMPGEIKSLNVSNAAAIALYAAHGFLKRS